MTRLIARGLALVIGLSSTALAQAAPSLTGAAQCRAAANAYQARQLDSLRTAGTRLTSALITPIVNRSKSIARDCAAKIPLDGASAAELTTLATVHMYTGDTAQARAVLTRALATPGMTEAERADVLLGSESLAIASFDPFAGINHEAERIVAEIDQLSDAVIQQKLNAHRSLLGRYEYADNDDGLRDQARKLLVLAKRALATKALGMTPARPTMPSYNVAYSYITTAYSSLARGEGDFLDAAAAIKVIDDAVKEIGDAFPDARRELAPQRDMYALVGTKATPIDGKWWVNGADGRSILPGDGKISVVQFTAHWCVPCRNSYPGFKRMTTHFSGKPVEAMMVTDLYGYIGDRPNLTPEQEVAADREYYADHHGLSYPIAINPSLARADSLVQDNNRRYAVNGIPEIVVVDRKGNIRATVVGWDKGNEQRLTAFIDKLLTEK